MMRTCPCQKNKTFITSKNDLYNDMLYTNTHIKEYNKSTYTALTSVQNLLFCRGKIIDTKPKMFKS